jgi:hypothetical protein
MAEQERLLYEQVPGEAEPQQELWARKPFMGSG